MKRFLTNLCVVVAFFAVIFGMGYTLVSSEPIPCARHPHKQHHEKFVCPNCGFELPMPPHKGPAGEGRHGHHDGMNPQAPDQSQLPEQPQCPVQPQGPDQPQCQAQPQCPAQPKGPADNQHFEGQPQPAPQCKDGRPMPPAPKAPAEPQKPKPAPRK